VSEKLPPSIAHHSVLAATIPALVHRANNCLSVINGTLDMASGLTPEDRAVLDDENEALTGLLEHLAFQSRGDICEVGVIELHDLLSELEFILGIIGRFLHCEVEFRYFVTAATVQGDRARLYRLLVSLCSERLTAMAPLATGRGVPPTLRVCLSAPGARARLVLADTGGGLPGDLRLREAFQDEAGKLGELWGFELSSRAIGSAHAYLLSAPVLSASRPKAAVRKEAGRILLVQPAGVDAELNVAVLSEQGYRVEHRDSIDGSWRPDGFDLVLCDEELFDAIPISTPHVLVLGESAKGQGWALGAISKPIKPLVLLERVGKAIEG
jgi:hypothetical protein